MTAQYYFKGNPATNPNTYLPPCALANRHPKNFLVELPQGHHPFHTNTRKKQYSLHHHSEIRDTNALVMDPHQ